MVASRATPGLTPALQRRIAEHRVEVARLRAEFGDPEEALSAFVRAHFDRDALVAALRDELDHATEPIDGAAEPASDG